MKASTFKTCRRSYLSRLQNIGGWGFFYCCTVLLAQIINVANETNNYPTLVDTSEEAHSFTVINTSTLFDMYNPRKTGIFFDFFSCNSEIIIPNSVPIDFHAMYQCNSYYTIDYHNICPVVKKYFSPSEKVLDVKKALIKNYTIEPEKCIGVYYRETDKCTETVLASFSQFKDKLDKIKTGEKIVLVTDSQQCREYFEREYGDDLICFKENKVSNANVGIHFANSKSTNYNDMFNLFASLLIISGCKNILCGSGNGSLWIMLFRGNCEGIYQILDKKWIEGNDTSIVAKHKVIPIPKQPLHRSKQTPIGFKMHPRKY